MASKSFGEVRERMLAQHEELRAAIRGLLDNMTGRVSAAVPLLERLVARFDLYVAFEERELSPMIRTIDAWGREREAALQAEHAAQRGEIARVCALARDPGPAARVTLEIVLLADTLLDDMAAEEATMAELEQIDAFGLGEQMTG